MFMPCIVYATSIHLAWTKGSPNHERISQHSQCFLQSTRTDLTYLKSLQLDPAVEMVTLILDVTTDKSHFHLVKQAAEGEAAEGEAAEGEAAEGESGGSSSISINQCGIEVKDVACQAGEVSEAGGGGHGSHSTVRHKCCISMHG